MKLKSIRHTDIAGKTVLYRSPYDIGVEKVNGILEVKDDSRIRATLSTLRYLLEKDCKIVVLTWVKRPDGKVVDELRTVPHAKKLEELLEHEVDTVDDCVGTKVESRISKMKAGDILMLENVRFHREEMVDDDNFAKELTKSKDLIVFDAFPQAHRIHSSTTGILRHLPGYAGFYLEKEVTALNKLVENPDRPFTLVIGGAKISDKIDAINNLYDKVDVILVGGGVANVFLKASDKNLGASYMEDIFVDKVKKEKKDWAKLAREILKRKPDSDSYKDFGVESKVLNPIDLVIGDSLSMPNESKIVGVGKKEEVVPPGWAALDIGPETANKFTEIIRKSATVFWNGPMGVFEDERFSLGSKAIVNATKKVRGNTVIGGGDTIEAIRKFGNVDDYSHTSLAGGATLELLSGNKLPALELLES